MPNDAVPLDSMSFSRLGWVGLGGDTGWGGMGISSDLVLIVGAAVREKGENGRREGKFMKLKRLGTKRPALLL